MFNNLIILSLDIFDNNIQAETILKYKKTIKYLEIYISESKSFPINKYNELIQNLDKFENLTCLALINYSNCKFNLHNLQ